MPTKSKSKIINDRRKVVYDRKGNLLGYTEYAGDGLYNHYNQELKFLACTDSIEFDFEKYYADDTEEIDDIE